MSEIGSKDENELVEAVNEKLESRGVLEQIRANIRSQVVQVLKGENGEEVKLGQISR